MAAGIIAALLFLVNYSRVDVVRHAASRADYAGAIQRAPLYEQLLERRGRNMAILTLQGYVFFGSPPAAGTDHGTAGGRKPAAAALSCHGLSPGHGHGLLVCAEFRPAETGDGCKDVFVVLTALSRIQ
ncbi:MAG: hypothetical protein R3A10_17605 [Caldilineaceae bacterium]